jgi:hypothetical protein
VCSPCHVFCKICKSKIFEPQSVKSYTGVSGSSLTKMLCYFSGLHDVCGTCQIFKIVIFVIYFLILNKHLLSYLILYSLVCLVCAVVVVLSVLLLAV